MNRPLLICLLFAALIALLASIVFWNNAHKTGNVHLGPSVFFQGRPGAQVSNVNVYAYNNGTYCGKGVYQSTGDKYAFRCNITVRILPKNTPTPVPVPTVQPTQVSGCSDDRSCANAALSVLNQERSKHGVSPLVIDWNMSLGTGSCIGAKGHSLHMAQTGQLGHDQFPADVCGYTSTAGENIGYAYGDEWSAFQQINQEMLSEPWTSGCQTNHHCNIDYPGYTRIGIGFANSGGTIWLTEDFSG